LSISKPVPGGGRATTFLHPTSGRNYPVLVPSLLSRGTARHLGSIQRAWFSCFGTDLLAADSLFPMRRGGGEEEFGLSGATTGTRNSNGATDASLPPRVSGNAHPRYGMPCGRQQRSLFHVAARATEVELLMPACTISTPISGTGKHGVFWYVQSFPTQLTQNRS